MSLFGVSYEDVTYGQAHLAYLTNKFLGFHPGACRKYNNHNFGLAGHIIAERSGVSYGAFIFEHILNPLGLDIAPKRPFLADQTGLDSSRYGWFDSGVPYRISDFDSSQRVYGAYGYKRTDLGLAAGGWESSARDLVRLLCATDRLGNQSDILSEDSLDEMESVPFPETDASQAHGWSKSGSKLAHSGLQGEGAAYMAKWGTSINVAVVINTGNGISLSGIAGNVKTAIENASIPFNYDLFESAPLGTLTFGE
jgi:CubicO group peptidase (beta-lactamase class C family)